MSSMHKKLKKPNGYYYLCNQAVTANIIKMSDNWEKVTCKNCLKQRPQKEFLIDIEQLAEDHAEWYSQLCKRVYKEAFVHGYKHGVADTKR